MRVLHLMTDWIFADGPIEVFLSCDIHNKFVILRETDDKDIRKIQLAQYVDVVEIGTAEYEDIKNCKWDLIWVHGLTNNHARFVLSLKQKTFVMWSTWGYDYVRFASRWLYGVHTTFLWLKITPFKTIVKTILTYLVAKTGLVRFLPHLHCRFFRLVDFYSVVISDEDQFMSRILKKTARRVDFHYIGLKPKQGEVIEFPVVDLNAKRIWIGNSATLTNNHIDVFHIVSKLREYQVLVPLSYALHSKRDIVTDMIDSIGVELLKERFCPIHDFMPFDEYKNLMSTCAVFIFAHRRQQSVGNLCLALRLGGCVIMNSCSPAYQYFTRHGVVIYSLAELNRRGINKILTEFRLHQRENIERYKQLRNYDKLVSEIKHSVDYLRAEIDNEVLDV